MARKNISSLHLPHNKHTDNVEPVRIETPEEVVLPMDMHSGDHAIPVVNVGDRVLVGQLIAKEGDRFSSPVHATVSGTVTEISEMVDQPYRLHLHGLAYDKSGELTNKPRRSKPTLAIHIKSDGKMEKDPGLKPPVFETADEFLQAIRESGCVGLGGAAFPTWAKLNEMKNPEYKVKHVLINAAECEPYITSDQWMMIKHPDLIDKGIAYMRKYLAEYLHDADFIICIEENKPRAIEAMKETFKDQKDVKIQVLKAIYPQGAKQVMLYNATGKVSIAGKRFPYFGAVIINVSSLAKTAEYLSTGMPLVERIVTVDGSAVKTPMVLEAPIGTRISTLLSYTGLKSDPGKIIIGGPMNGTATAGIDDPIVKVSNCILAFDEKEAVLPAPTACIHCGRCVNICPVGINVASVEPALAIEDENLRAKKLIDTGIRQCVDCASCAYVCPANRKLLQANGQAKRFLKNWEKTQSNGGKR
ncbi:MAG: RnfABCDGE type electron transport complex subunit C [Clostridia bacterium]|nr:RnfABCDGE type electron transport complex subunit C [Clostridia bacterium]